MFICLDFTEVIKHSFANLVLCLRNESFLSWFLFSLILHQIASSNCKQHVTGTGISLFCPGVGTVYPWAMFLQGIPGTQCHYPNLKDLAVKRKSRQWSWIDIYPSDSLLLRSIYDKRQGKGWNWRKLCPPPPPHLLFQGLDDRPVSEGLHPPLVCYLCFLNIFREQKDSKRKY